MAQGVWNMYTNDYFKVKLAINLENGVYLLNAESATGKTRLCKELRNQYLKFGDVYSVTYHSLKPDKIQLSSQGDFKVIMFDRFDLYSQDAEVKDLILKYCEQSIILIDCKNNFSFEGTASVVDIHMEQYRIEVGVAV